MLPLLLLFLLVLVLTPFPQELTVESSGTAGQHLQPWSAPPLLSAARTSCLMYLPKALAGSKKRAALRLGWAASGRAGEAAGVYSGSGNAKNCCNWGYFRGQMRALRWWDRGLSFAQIESAKPPPPPPPPQCPNDGKRSCGGMYARTLGGVPRYKEIPYASSAERSHRREGSFSNLAVYP